MTRTLYDASNPNHVRICGRTACAGREPHQAGRHLDQRDELYDGPDTVLLVLPLSVRDSARKIIREAPGFMPEVMDMAHEIEFLRDQVAHLRVEKDREVREAMARSESCETHGEEIKELGQQLQAMGRAHDKADRARVALVAFLHGVDEFVREFRAGRSVATGMTVAKVVAALEGFSKKAHAAHERAWK